MKTGPALASALALALGGCVDNNASVEVYAICAPPDAAATCGTNGSCTALLANPRLFVFTTVDGFVNELQEFVEFRNRMPENDNTDVGRTNTNDFVGGEYLLSFRGVSGLADVTYPANFTVPANGTSTPIVTFIPTGTMANIANSLPAGGTALVIVEVRVRGKLQDGTTLETGVFEVAVDVINDDFQPAGCANAGDVRFYCPNAGQTASTECGTL